MTFLPDNTPLSPAEKDLVNRPEVQELIKHFSLEIVPSKKYLESVRIASEVEKILKAISTR
jgi:hypothetical protein